MPSPKYEASTIKKKEYDILYKESNEFSEFDPLNSRYSMFMRAFHTHTATIITYESKYGKIIALLDTPEQKEQIPWELWFRILRTFYMGYSFTIFFLANIHLRRFPEKGHAIIPQNINGGYTYPCNHEYICIYRAEDATRVLIHELFHASCSDNNSDGIDRVEAKTEAWAELFYGGFISEGNYKAFTKEIIRQSAWMRGQNKEVCKYIVSCGKDSYEFPWRYTIGKELYWKQWGILNTQVKHANVHGSLRLTPPPTTEQKQIHSVSHNSVIL